MSDTLDPKAGLELAQAEILKDPNSANNWNRAAIAYLQLGELDKAAEYISHAIALDPEESLNYSNRGRIMFALNRLQEALDDYSKAIELEPKAELYSSRSVVNLALGKDAAALADLNDAYDLDPSAANLLNRAAFFSNKGMAADALRDVSQVVEMEPDNPHHRLTRANLAFALGRHYPELYELGLTDVEQAIRLDQTGVLQPSLEQLAVQLEAHLLSSPNKEVSWRLIELIRQGNRQ